MKQHHEARNNKHFYAAIIFAIMVALLVITAAVSVSAKLRLSGYAGNVIGARASIVLNNNVYTGAGFEWYGWYSNDLTRVKKYVSPYAFAGYRYLHRSHEVYVDISIGYADEKYVDAFVSNKGGAMPGITIGYNYHVGKRASIGFMLGYRTAHIYSPYLKWFATPVLSDYRYLLFGTTLSFDM